MGLAESLMFYLLIGLGGAAAVWLSTDDRPGAQRLFPTTTAVLFWPIYVPLLLSRPPVPRPAPVEAQEPADSMTLMIAHVEAELDAALASLDGWAEETLSRESARIAELKAAWSLQAARIREMDHLLTPASAPVAELTGEWPSRSEEARQENLQRLREIRRKAFEELTATLAWVRELVSKIHLAKFSGASAAQAEELVAQIAAAVEGISEVTAWRPHPADHGIRHAG